MATLPGTRPRHRGLGAGSSDLYDLACPSAKAESNNRPADLNPIFSLTKRAASAAPYSRSMPQSSHSTESGPS